MFPLLDDFFNPNNSLNPNHLKAILPQTDDSMTKFFSEA